MSTIIYHPVDPQPEIGVNEAPEGHVWVCVTCMNSSGNKHAPLDETWRACCHNNSVLCMPEEIEDAEALEA